MAGRGSQALDLDNGGAPSLRASARNTVPGFVASGPDGANPNSRRLSANGLDPSGGTSIRKTFRQMEQEAEQQKRVRKELPRHVAVSRKVVDHGWWIGFTGLLTVYALIGDDCRLIATNKPYDMMFNGFCIFCMLVFGTDLVLCCLGKDDYFLGFFFWLDVLSTASLVFDLSWVADGIAALSSELEDTKAAKSARAGAKLGRVVRVIRLVRILKLYKAFYEARARKRREEERAQRDPTQEDDDWDDLDIEANNDPSASQNRESRVGKKLSEMTTRRVIILVLVMLLIVPNLQADTSHSPASATYGADHVWANFERYRNGQAPKEEYENAMLRLIYFHNWFLAPHWVDATSSCPSDSTSPSTISCSNGFYSQLFWFGMAGVDQEIVEEMAVQARINQSTVELWKQQRADRRDMYYVFGEIPQRVVDTISSAWMDPSVWMDRPCTTSTEGEHLRGVSLIADEGYGVQCPNQLRVQERKEYTAKLISERGRTYRFSFYFDLRPYVKSNAAFNIGITIFVCFMLLTASVLFSNDANRLVLLPVENMIKRVEAIRDDPLIAMKMADDEFKLEEVAKAKARKQRAQERLKTIFNDVVHGGGCGRFNCRREVKEPMETVILEKTIIKLGSLLALGFGEAGANIIGMNMANSNTAGVNAMIPGTKVECVIGFTRILNFSTATEVLQGKIVTFVNQVAEIVHGVVSEFHGAANKNNGDTFLIIWRVMDLEADTYAEDVGRMSEMSMVAFSIILGVVHRSQTLATYREHPGLQQRLGTDSRVNLSFSLHYGWAVEGAVGSDFKIDASYLSPHVSIATSIEAAAQIYRVPILITDMVIGHCTASMSNRCRLIDKVIITGSKRPMELFSLDLDYLSLEVDKYQPLQITWNTKKRFEARQFLDKEKAKKWEIELSTYFDEDPYILQMRQIYTVEFMQFFNMGYQNYSQGEWSVARKMLEQTRSKLGHMDGPSVALLKFMEDPYQYVAPKGWDGTRDLPRILATS